MKLQEISAEYRAHAEALKNRIHQLRCQLSLAATQRERSTLQGRIRILSAMYREAMEIAVYLERYYDRRCRRNVSDKV